MNYTKLYAQRFGRKKQRIRRATHMIYSRRTAWLCRSILERMTGEHCVINFRPSGGFMLERIGADGKIRRG